MKIVTCHIKPPISLRCFDWAAIDADTYDGAWDSNAYSEIGWGRTEQEAIEDLQAQLAERNNEPKL